MTDIAILFARNDSIYKTLPGCDVYDEQRDALSYDGTLPVIAHPPCRLWGRLRTFATCAPAAEAELARFAVWQVRKCAGVLEHPFGSRLWEDQRLPRPGEIDAWGGWTLPVLQYWFGHRAEKATWLYIVGVRPEDLPPFDLRMGTATHVIQSRKRTDHRPHVTRRERDATPLAFAHWLCAIARKATHNVRRTA